MTARPVRLPRTTEAAEAAALWAWRDTLAPQWLALRLMIHVPNEAKRAPWRARPMGIVAGVPDVLLLVSCGGWTGLALELKAGAGKPTLEQVAFLAALEGEGWWAEVVTFRRPGDWVLAAQIVARYLGMPEDTVPVVPGGKS